MVIEVMINNCGHFNIDVSVSMLACLCMRGKVVLEPYRIYSNVAEHLYRFIFEDKSESLPGGNDYTYMIRN